jgi:hypothetical protein
LPPRQPRGFAAPASPGSWFHRQGRPPSPGA